MTVTQALGDLGRLRATCYRRRVELAWPAKLGLAVMMAALTGLVAQLRIPLPYTSVPLTGQTFAVLLSAVLLGRTWGGVSQAFYVGSGLAGVPWFAGWTSGVPVTPTAGFLVGFIVAAVVVGYVTDCFIAARHFPLQVPVMIGGIAIIYAFGATGFAIQTGAGFSATLAGAVFPFILPDLGKAIAAAAVASTLLPKTVNESSTDC